MNRGSKLLAALVLILSLCGCAADVKTIPFEAKAQELTGNIAVSSAYNLQSVFTVEEGLIRDQFGFDGEDVLIGASTERNTGAGQLFLVDMETGVCQQIMRSGYGEIVQLETLMDGTTVAYILRSSNTAELMNRSGFASEYKVCVRRGFGAEEIVIAELGQNTELIMLAERMSDSGTEFCYIWGEKGEYRLNVVDAETLEQRIYPLYDIIPNLISRNLVIKGFYQKDDAHVAGNVMLNGNEYYWEAELPEETMHADDEETEFSKEWLIENVRVIEVNGTRKMQAGDYVYYLEDNETLYRMDPDDEITKELATSVKNFCISGDETTVVYLTEKNGTSMLYADKIGEQTPVLLNVNPETGSMQLNNNGSKLAVTYYETSSSGQKVPNIAIFDLVYRGNE